MDPVLTRVSMKKSPSLLCQRAPNMDIPSIPFTLFKIKQRISVSLPNPSHLQRVRPKIKIDIQQNNHLTKTDCQQKACGVYSVGQGIYSELEKLYIKQPLEQNIDLICRPFMSPGRGTQFSEPLILFILRSGIVLRYLNYHKYS